MNQLTYIELAALPIGTRLTFTEIWDIYPFTVVPAGTVCTVHENDLGNADATLTVLPNNDVVRADLAEWDGCIILSPVNDGRPLDELSPLALDGSAEYKRGFFDAVSGRPRDPRGAELGSHALHDYVVGFLAGRKGV